MHALIENVGVWKYSMYLVFVVGDGRQDVHFFLVLLVELLLFQHVDIPDIIFSQLVFVIYFFIPNKIVAMKVVSGFSPKLYIIYSLRPNP
jgi:hypothetical protein